MLRVSRAGRWLPAVAQTVGGAPAPRETWPGAVLDSLFSPRYLGEGTVWQRDVRGPEMPLADNSSALAAWMWENTPTPWVPAGSRRPFGARTALNRSTYGTDPIPAYLVDSTHPDCEYQEITGARAHGIPQEITDVYLNGRVPWPGYAIPAQNQDRGLAIYDVGTGIMREWFYVESAGPGRWTCLAGGWSLARPGLTDLADTNWATQLQAGSNAVACMHNPLGFIGAEEVRRGEIEHALAFTTANFASHLPPSWPAKMSDGKAPAEQAPFSPTHGQWARLPAGVSPDLDPRTGAPYKPLTRLLIRAAQRYGLVCTDTNTWAHAFNAESGHQARAVTGRDPWEDGGELARVLSPDDPGSAFDVSDFPWDRTEWAPVDWGRPSPDFSLRPGQYTPWRRV